MKGLGRMNLATTAYPHNEPPAKQPKQFRPKSTSPIRAASPVHSPSVATTHPSLTTTIRPATAPAVTSKVASGSEREPIQISAPILSPVVCK